MSLVVKDGTEDDITPQGLPPFSVGDQKFGPAFTSLVPPGPAETAWKFQLFYNDPDGLNRLALRPEIETAMKLAPEPKAWLQEMVNRSYLANETGIPVNELKGPLLEMTKDAYARRNLNVLPGERVDHPWFYQAVGDTQQRIRQLNHPASEPYPLKREALARIGQIPLSGQGVVLRTIAQGELLSIPTADDPIVPDRIIGVEGESKEIFRIWTPEGEMVTGTIEEASQLWSEVREALTNGKPLPPGFRIRPEEMGRRVDGPMKPGIPLPPPLPVPEPSLPSVSTDGATSAEGSSLGELAVEGGARFLRGGARSLVNTKLGIDLWLRELGRDSVNPYVDMTVAEARVDLERLNAEITAHEAKYKNSKPVYPLSQNSPTARLNELKQKRELAELASRGIAEESYFGSLYRSAQEEIAWNMEKRREVQEMFRDQINPDHDNTILMQAFEGVGEGAFSMVATAGSMGLGTTVSFLGSQGEAYANYMENAAERGLDTGEQAGFAYANKQAIGNAAWDLAGNVSGLRTFKGALAPKGVTGHIANLTRGAVENAVTAAGQSTTEGLIGENAGLYDKTTLQEKAARAAEAATVGMVTTGIIAGSGVVTGKILDLSLGKKGKGGDSDQKAGPASRDGQAVEGGGDRNADSSSNPPETEKGNLRSPSSQAKKVRAWADEIRAGWKSKPEVVVHDSAEAIGDARLREAVLKEGGGVRAFFDPKDGRIHLLADRIGSKAEAVVLMRHEGVHRTLRGPMKQEYAKVLEQIGRSIRWEDLQETIRQYPKGTPDLWIEEHLARIGETNPQSSVWKQAVAAIRQILREQFGADLKFSDNDIKAFLTRANRRFEQARESDYSYFDGQSEGDPLFAKVKKKQGQDRKSWSEVRMGDNWNSVKRLFYGAREDVEPLEFPNQGEKNEVVDRVVDYLKNNPVLTDWTGRTVYLPYTETRGSYQDPLKNRAEHLIASEEKKGSHIRTLNREKTKWVAAIPSTIREGAVRISDGSEVLYLRNYNGYVHIVVTGQEGVLIRHAVRDRSGQKVGEEVMKFDSGLVSQYPINLKDKNYKTSDPKVDALRVIRREIGD